MSGHIVWSGVFWSMMKWGLLGVALSTTWSLLKIIFEHLNKILEKEKGA